MKRLALLALLFVTPAAAQTVQVQPQAPTSADYMQQMVSSLVRANADLQAALALEQTKNKALEEEIKKLEKPKQ